MKKKLLLLIIPFMLIACSMANTPTSKVEELFAKYQKIDTDINLGIDSVLDEQNLTDNHKARYRKLLDNVNDKYDVIINIEKKIDIFGFLLLNNIFMNEYIDLINLFSLFLSFLSRFFEKVFGILVPFN